MNRLFSMSSLGLAVVLAAAEGCHMAVVNSETGEPLVPVRRPDSTPEQVEARRQRRERERQFEEARAERKMANAEAKRARKCARNLRHI